MAEIRIFDAKNSLKELTADFLPKIQNIAIRESIQGEADSINIVLANNPNSKNYWNLDYFQDREVFLKVMINNVDYGVFNFDEIEFSFTESGNFISMNGLSAPVTTGKSIYQKIRKVWGSAKLETILKEIAKIADLDLSYNFDKFKLKLQIQNEFLFNIFTRLAFKYGAVTKVYKDKYSGRYTILFYGKSDLAENAALLKKSEIAGALGRGEGLLKIDAKKPDKNVMSINFRIVANTKELKIVYYNPFDKKTYSKTSKNKSKLIVEESRADYQIEKVTSAEEAEIVARRVENEPAIVGEMTGKYNKDYISGNIIEFKNYQALSGYYLIMNSSHSFSETSETSSCSFERLPDENLTQYLKYLN